MSLRPASSLEQLQPGNVVDETVSDHCSKTRARDVERSNGSASTAPVFRSLSGCCILGLLGAVQRAGGEVKQENDGSHEGTPVPS